MSDSVLQKLKLLAGNLDRDLDYFHLGKVLLKTLKKYSNNINQIDEATGGSETNESVRRRSILMAIWLRKYGINEGDVIFLSAANHLDICIPFIAALYIGAVIFPVDKNLKKHDMKHVMQLAKPKLIFCDPDASLSVIAEAASALEITSKIIVFGDEINKTYENFTDILQSCEEDIEQFRPAELNPATSPALIICTSGSTGLPKGVTLTHKGVTGRTFVWEEERPSYEDEIIMAVSSLHWYTAPVAILLCCMFGASRVQSSKPFTPDTGFRIMNKYKPTRTILSPAAAIALLGHPNSSAADWTTMRNVMMLGSILGKETISALLKKLSNGRVVNAYAMTELCGLVCCEIIERVPDQVSVGKIEPPFLTKIVDSNGCELGPNEPGELLVKSDFIFSGYYNNEAATTETFTDDGWFKTGDILYYDIDQRFYVVDRVKTMMKYKANQISPSELEAVILTHPSVVMVVVDKLEVPPDDLPVALVVRKPGTGVTAQEIKDLLTDNLAPFKQLHGGVAFVDSIPFTATGKFDRKIIKDIIKTIQTE